MGLDVTISVFGVSDKARFKPVSSASENIDIPLEASLHMILFNQLITRVAGWSVLLLFANPPKTGFLLLRTISKP